MKLTAASSLIAFLFAVCPVISSAAPQTNVDDRFYVGINPMAAVASLKLGNPYATMLVPIASNQEYGLALAVGWYPFIDHGVEMRFSFGQTPMRSIMQNQLAYSFFPFGRTSARRLSGAYVGMQVRYWDYEVLASGVHSRNLMPAVHLGHRWTIGSAFVDLRLSQSVAIATWSSQEHVKSAVAWRFSPIDREVPVLPVLGVTVGYLF